MTNREKLTAAIEAQIKARTKLGVEIEDYADAVDSTDLCDCFEGLHSQAADNGYRDICKACDDLLIKVGYYSPVPADAERAGEHRGPTRKGVRYDCDASFSQWVSR